MKTICKAEVTTAINNIEVYMVECESMIKALEVLKTALEKVSKKDEVLTPKKLSNLDLPDYVKVTSKNRKLDTAYYYKILTLEYYNEDGVDLLKDYTHNNVILYIKRATSNGYLVEIDDSIESNYQSIDFRERSKVLLENLDVDKIHELDEATKKEINRLLYVFK